MYKFDENGVSNPDRTSMRAPSDTLHNRHRTGTKTNDQTPDSSDSTDEQSLTVPGLDTDAEKLATSDLLDPAYSENVDDDLADALAAVGQYQAAFAHDPSLARAEIVGIESYTRPRNNVHIRVTYDPPIGDPFERHYDMPDPESTPAENEFMRLMAQVGDDLEDEPIGFDSVARMDGATVPLYWDSEKDRLEVEITYGNSLGPTQTPLEKAYDKTRSTTGAYVSALPAAIKKTIGFTVVGLGVASPVVAFIMLFTMRNGEWYDTDIADSFEEVVLSVIFTVALWTSTMILYLNRGLIL